MKLIWFSWFSTDNFVKEKKEVKEEEKAAEVVQEVITEEPEKVEEPKPEEANTATVDEVKKGNDKTIINAIPILNVFSIFLDDEAKESEK